MQRCLWLLGGLVTVLTGVGVIVSGPDHQASAQQAGTVIVEASDCTILLKDERTLAADRPGILEFVEPDEGDQVFKGQEVARLKDGVARATLAKEQERARNDVHIRFARKASEYAATELEASELANLKVVGTVPFIEIEKLRLAAQKGVLSIEQAEFDQRIAQLTVVEAEEALKTYQVQAPFDGIVSRLHRRPGEAVRQGDPILEVISTSRVKIEGYVSIADSYRVKAGDRVRVRLDLAELDLPFENQVFDGEVIFVDPRVSTVINKVTVWAEVENPDGILKPGLNARMSIFPQPASPRAAAATRP